MYKIGFLTTDIAHARVIAPVWDGPVISIRNNRHRHNPGECDAPDFVDNEAPAAKHYGKHLHLYFDDFIPHAPIYSVSDHTEDYFLPNIEQIRRLAHFADSMVNLNHKTFLVHCDGGVSRSPAVSIGLGCWYNRAKLDWFARHVKNFRLPQDIGFTPNHHVLWLMNKWNPILGYDEWEASALHKAKFCDKYVAEIDEYVARYRHSFGCD